MSRKANHWQTQVDYWSKLSPEEQDFLTKFHNEQYNNSYTQTLLSIEQTREAQKDLRKQSKDAQNYVSYPIEGDSLALISDVLTPEEILLQIEAKPRLRKELLPESDQ